MAFHNKHNSQHGAQPWTKRLSQQTVHYGREDVRGSNMTLPIPVFFADANSNFTHRDISEAMCMLTFPPFSMSILSCRNSHHVWFGRSVTLAKLEAVTWPVFQFWVRQTPWVGWKASDSSINLGQDKLFLTSYYPATFLCSVSIMTGTEVKLNWTRTTPRLWGGREGLFIPRQCPPLRSFTAQEAPWHSWQELSSSTSESHLGLLYKDLLRRNELLE